MNEKKRFKINSGMLLLICLAVIVLIFATGVLNKQKVWPDLQLEYRDGKKTFSVDEGDSYGMVSSGPYYDLPEGTYRIKWQMEGDGENAIVVTCSNDVEITPREILTTPGAWQGEAYFDIKGPAHNVSFNVEFREGTKLNIYNFRLYTPEYTDHAFTVSALLLSLWLLFTFRSKLKEKETREALVILGFAATFASLAFLREDALMAWDVQYHTLRTMNLVDGLVSGQFPVRCGGFSYNGYGAVTSVFYPDLFIYPLALMIMGGASLSYVMNAAAIAVNVLSAFTMYIAGKRLLKDHCAALCASVLYVLSMLRFAIGYDSYMLGFLLAMVFMPLFFAELWEVLTGDKNRWIYLAIDATLIFQSHLLSTLLCALSAIAGCLIFLPQVMREKRILPIFKAVGLALLLNVFRILPMLTYYLDGVNTPTAQFGFVNMALEVYEVIEPDGFVGLAMLLGAAALLAAERSEEENPQVRFVAWMFLCAGGVCAFLSTDLTPWSYIVKLTGGLVEVFQFPWRMLVPGTVFLAIAGGYGYARLLGGKGAKTALLVLALSVVSASPWMEYVFEEKGVLQFGQGANAYIITPEYQIEGTDVGNTRSRAVLIEGDAKLTEYEKKGTEITAQLDAAEDARVMVPLFGFDGYAAAINGERVDWTRGENNRLTVDIPAGTQGELHIWFEGKAVWRVTDAISAVTLLCLLGTWLKKKRRLH